MGFIDIFPTVLFYEEIKEINLNYLKSFILDSKREEDKVNGSFTTLSNILNESPFLELKKIILEKSKLYLKEIGQSFPDLQISNSWGNVVNNNQLISSHVHANSHISGCFYLTKGSNINFLNPVTKNFMFYNPPLSNPNNPRSWNECIITPTPGLLILFPSFLKHYVSFSSRDNRISLAFNIVPKGEIGKQTSKLYL